MEKENNQTRRRQLLNGIIKLRIKNNRPICSSELQNRAVFGLSVERMMPLHLTDSQTAFFSFSNTIDPRNK